MNVTKANPVYHRRTGYHDSGYAFHFVRCLDKAALRKYVMSVPGVRREPWFDGAAEAAPEAFTVMSVSATLPGLIPEAAERLVCEIHMCVIEQDDPRVERRHWNHEIGHAVHFAYGAYDRVMDARWMVADEHPDLCAEFPAYCTEYLCETLDWLLGGERFTVESGFPFLFPWLGEAK